MLGRSSPCTNLLFYTYYTKIQRVEWPCTKLHKLEQKDRTKALAEFPDPNQQDPLKDDARATSGMSLVSIFCFDMVHVVVFPWLEHFLFSFFFLGTYCFTTSRSWSTNTDPPFLPPHPPRSTFRKIFCIHTSHPPSKGARVRENTDFVLTIWLTLGRRQLNHFVNKYYWTYPTQIYQTQSLSHFLPYFSLLTAWHCQTSQPVRSQKPGNFWKRSPKTWKFQGEIWRFQGKNWRFQGKNWRFQGKLEIHVIMHKWKLDHSDLTFLFCVQGQLFLCTCY